MTTHEDFDYILECSPDLKRWQPIGEKIPGERFGTIIDIPAAGPADASYYRIRQLAP